MNARQALITRLEELIGDPLAAGTIELVDAMTEEACQLAIDNERDAVASNSGPDY